MKGMNRFIRFGKSPERFGLIHSDLRLANLLVENNRILVIGFDDCGFRWYLYDLATSTSFIEHKPHVPSLIQSWLRGYRKIRPLSKEVEIEIMTFIMMRKLQLLAWVGSTLFVFPLSQSRRSSPYVANRGASAFVLD